MTLSTASEANVQFCMRGTQSAARSLGDQQARKLRINETNTYTCAGMQITDEMIPNRYISLFHPKRSLMIDFTVNENSFSFIFIAAV